MKMFTIHDTKNRGLTYFTHRRTARFLKLCITPVDNSGTNCLRIFKVFITWNTLNAAVNLIFKYYDLPRQFWGAKPPTQFRHTWADMSHSDHYTDSEPASRLPSSVKHPNENRKPPIFTSDSMMWRGPESNPTSRTLIHSRRGSGAITTGKSC